jgi:hypothetical protein
VGAADKPTALDVDGAAHPWQMVQGESPPAELLGLAVVPSSLSLQAIIHLRQRTGHPVLVSEEERIIGVCSEHDIIRALSGRAAR